MGHSTFQNCEFCLELHDVHRSRFHELYGARAPSRIIARADGLVALPTLGQLFPGSILILPEEHVETMGCVHRDRGAALAAFVARLEALVAPSAPAVVFEHGARCESGGSCGIYHAHLHVVPVPGAVACSDLLPADALETFPSLQAAWASLGDSAEYLLVRDTAGVVSAHDSTRFPRRFASQHFRRALTEHFRVDRPWDWRAYTHVEPDLLRTLEMAGNVPVG